MEQLNLFFDEHPKLKLILQCITGIAIGAAILIIVLNLTADFRARLSRKQDILNFFNRKSISLISKETVDELKRLDNLEVASDEINITPVIIDYLSKLEVAVKNYDAETLTTATLNKDFMDSSIIYTYLGTDISFLAKTIKNNSQSGDYILAPVQFLNYVQKEMEKVLIHKSDKMISNWYINKEYLEKHGKALDKHKTQYEVELPFKCLLNISLPQVNKLDYKFVDVRLENRPDKKDIKATLIDEDKKEFDTYITFEHTDYLHKNDMSFNFLGILYDYTKPKVTLYSIFQKTDD